MMFVFRCSMFGLGNRTPNSNIEKRNYMEWILLFFFMPFVLTLMFFNWLEQKFFAFRDKEKLEDGEQLLHEKQFAEAQVFFTEKLKSFPKSALK